MYKLEADLIVNETGDVRTLMKAGEYVLQEATGKLSNCKEAELPIHVERIHLEVVARDEAIAIVVQEKLEAEELKRQEEEALKEEPKIEEEILP
jgi:hypothetical protein